MNQVQKTVRKSDSTRDAILETAYELFLEKGYNATSTRDIAQRAGLALGGLYNHFPGKADIFAAVFIERHPFLEIMAAANAATGDTIEEVVRDAARQTVHAFKERPKFLNLMFIESVEFKAQHVPHLLDKLIPLVKGFGQHFAAAQVRGEMRPMPLMIAVRGFIALFMSYAVSERLIGGLLEPHMQTEDTLDQLVDIYLYGITARKDCSEANLKASGKKLPQTKTKPRRAT